MTSSLTWQRRESLGSRSSNALPNLWLLPVSSRIKLYIIILTNLWLMSPAATLYTRTSPDDVPSAMESASTFAAGLADFSFFLFWVICQIKWFLNSLEKVITEVSDKQFKIKTSNSNENDELSSKWHRHTRKKIWVFLSGVEPRTFLLLVRMPYHWATGDSWKLRLLN